MRERHVFVVLTNARDGRDDEFNDWYTNRHIADVLDVPGIVRAERFEISGAQIRDDAAYRYCALYEIETDDLEGVLETLRDRAGTDAMPITKAIDRDRIAIVYKPMS
ncbi:hypothetical protein HKCCE2091_03740 [Rhodobacterales bacterium HKCCE2091]|nr:hypothetical protein [Rhodobacterales bacterium HKCCE2091]